MDRHEHDQAQDDLFFAVESSSSKRKLKKPTGVLPSQYIEQMYRRNFIESVEPLVKGQIQPASIDLRLGKRAYRVRASFLPGAEQSVREALEEYSTHEIDLEHGAIFEEGKVYVVELEEFLNLPDSIAAVANPKSSTGRLDVFTRLITDGSDMFDYVISGYKGALYAEIYPRSFSIRVRQGSRLNQLRFRRHSGQQDRYDRSGLTDTQLKKLHKKTPIVGDDKAVIRSGLNLSVDLRGKGTSSIIGYRAKPFSDIVDVDAVKAHAISEYWEPIKRPSYGKIILDPNMFYILASKEWLYVPPEFAAEMIPIDPMMGEFRAHYAGFFDPGFGAADRNGARSRGVLEVRCDVPFVLEHGQLIARLVYEKMAEEPATLYGREIKSNYQNQGLKLSKHFTPSIRKKVKSKPGVKKTPARSSRVGTKAK